MVAELECWRDEIERQLVENGLTHYLSEHQAMLQRIRLGVLDVAIKIVRDEAKRNSMTKGGSLTQANKEAGNQPRLESSGG
jgi:hypothetical protein